MKKWFLLIISGMVSSCERDASCTDFINDYSGVETNIIVVDKGPDSRAIELKGLDPNSHKSLVFRGMAGFYILIRNNISLGDTLIKIKHSPLYIIKKNKYDVKVNLFCHDSINSGIAVDTVNKYNLKQSTTADNSPR
ncbi:hypothetical protein [Hymenobacter weizhouensis]|uniref:hypothetical protein n=1 Tax=Hymenobacter sp. YIM 151500-1 TaxID=2987689 RepID=UPI0022276C6A|nr:hypothetical protein [Hymenobacter sp. YIM 151500-1]UYZ62407.1 hypothetical protein OIS53_15575 [Hymenobacter sp. YIM 151500-1]